MLGFRTILQQHRKFTRNCFIRRIGGEFTLSHSRFSTKLPRTTKAGEQNDGSSENNATRTSQQSYDVIASTKNWVDQIIVAEKLCPFVMPLKSSNTLRYIESDATTIDQAVVDVAIQANLLIPEDAIALSSLAEEPHRCIVDNNAKLDIWALDDSDDDDNDNPNDVLSSVDGYDSDDATNNDVKNSKKMLLSEEVEKRMTDMNTLDTNRAMWDVLSEAQSHMNQQQDVRDRRTKQLHAFIAEAENPDSTMKIVKSIDEIPPGMIKQHYVKVFDELEESIRHVTPPLPSRPHGATLIMFNSKFVMDFRDFEDLCQEVYHKILFDTDYYDSLHIFLFHPHYLHTVYTDKKKFTAVDYVMRSPFPTLLLIREVDMKAAYLSDVIPYVRRLSERNKRHFRDQGTKACIKRLEGCYVAQKQNE